MSEVKNLNGKAGIEKIKSLTETKTCLFCTYTDSYSMESRPMTTMGVDDNGSMWYLCSKDSDIVSRWKNKAMLIFYTQIPAVMITWL